MLLGECPNGDQVTHCQEMLNSTRFFNMCYSGFFRNICCQTCAEARPSNLTEGMSFMYIILTHNLIKNKCLWISSHITVSFTCLHILNGQIQMWMEQHVPTTQNINTSAIYTECVHSADSLCGNEKRGPNNNTKF